MQHGHVIRQSFVSKAKMTLKMGNTNIILRLENSTTKPIYTSLLHCVQNMMQSQSHNHPDTLKTLNIFRPCLTGNENGKRIFAFMCVN